MHISKKTRVITYTFYHLALIRIWTANKVCIPQQWRGPLFTKPPGYIRLLSYRPAIIMKIELEMFPFNFQRVKVRKEIFCLFQDKLQFLFKIERSE